MLCAISTLSPRDASVLSHTGVTTGIRSKSLGTGIGSGGFCSTGDFSGVGLGVGTVSLSSLAPSGEPKELSVSCQLCLGPGCVWLMGSELEGGCGITLGNELDVFNASTEG